MTSCKKDEDAEDTNTNPNPYNTAFSLNLQTPVDEDNYNQVNWSTTNASIAGSGSNYSMTALDDQGSNFYLGTFNLATGTQTITTPAFEYMGVYQDLVVPVDGILSIDQIDQANQLITGTYSYDFVKYFNSATVTYTVTKTGQLVVSFSNVHYN